VRGLRAIDTKPKRVTLVWSNPRAHDLAGIVVRRAWNACPTTPHQGVHIGGSTVRTRQVDRGVAPGTSYCYAVFAFDSSHNYSRVALDQAVRTPALVTTPKPVSGLTAAADGSNVVLSWHNPAGLAFVAVRRGAANNCPTGPLAGTGIGSQNVRTSQTDTTATPGKAYCYRVFALNSADSASATTVEANITTHKPSPPPSRPTAAPSSGSGGWITPTLTHAVAGIAVAMLLLMAAATAVTRRRSHTSAYVTPQDLGPRLAISGYTPVALVIPALLILGSCTAIVLVLINL
jgi:hypothetical protein